MIENFCELHDQVKYEIQSNLEFETLRKLRNNSKQFQESTDKQLQFLCTQTKCGNLFQEYKDKSIILLKQITRITYIKSHLTMSNDQEHSESSFDQLSSGKQESKKTFKPINHQNKYFNYFRESDSLLKQLMSFNKHKHGIYQSLNDIQSKIPTFEMENIIVKNDTKIGEIKIKKNFVINFIVRLNKYMLNYWQTQRSILQIGQSQFDTIFGFNLKEDTDSKIKIKNSLINLHEILVDYNLPLDEYLNFEYICFDQSVILFLNKKILVQEKLKPNNFQPMLSQQQVQAGGQFAKNDTAIIKNLRIISYDKEIIDELSLEYKKKQKISIYRYFLDFFE